MAEQMRPASPQQAPDPSNSYERAHPEREAGMGRLDNNKAVSTDSPDRPHEAVSHRQDGSRQLNAHDAVNQRGGPAPAGQGRDQPDHSMNEEEPLDEGPTDIHDPTKQRHPRREGKGGVE